MSNAAVFLDTEPYDATMARPMGRNSAGEGFLRGVLKYADVDAIHLWNVHNRAQPELEAMIARLGPPARPVEWIAPADRPALARPGGVHIPTPILVDEAWARRAVGGTAYSLTGITHSIVEGHILAQLAGLLIAPIEEWDALVCTSEAARRAVATQLEAVAAHLHERFGVTRIPPAQLVTIPLGVHPDDFKTDEENRRKWRDYLGIPADGLAALHLGRFSVGTKMHPGPMGLALQAAAERVKKPLTWIFFGGGKRPEDEDHFRAAAAAFCPNVTLRFIDDTSAEARNEVWSAADVFLSLSDNIQETFGLTPLEAMAAGLPVVVSDWDGYKDTVRHGVDGFRIRTVAPRPGLAGDIAYAHAHGMIGYEDYAGSVAQFTAVDVGQASDALIALFSDPELRARMGAAGRARARATFDWRVIIPQYQALWAELARRRQAAPPQPPRLAGDNPWRLDPFRMFEGYPSATLAADDVASLSRPFAHHEAESLLARGRFPGAAPLLPTDPEIEAVVALLASGPSPVEEVLMGFPPSRRPFIERGLVWMAKFGVVRLLAALNRR